MEGCSLPAKISPALVHERARLAVEGCSLTAKISTVSDEAEKVYYIKDHLGSVRMTVNNIGTPVAWDDYYPFGAIMSGRSQVSSSDGRYKFTGKERDIAETGYDYFGARYYDSRIGRWLSIDPLADEYPGWSPYNYTLDNPINNYDPDGKEPFTLTSTGVVMAGAATIAVLGHTYNYITNPSYRRGYNSFSSSVVQVAGDAVDNVWNNVTNLFSSKESNANSNSSDESKESGGNANKLKPDPKAAGDHTTIKTDKDGNITNTAEWTKNPKNPSGFDEKKRTDVKGDSHYNKKTKQDVSTPHVHEKNTQGGVRPALENEIPKRN